MNVELASISRWKIGGPARRLYEPSSVDEVVRLLSSSERHLVIGETTNLLFDSDGFDGSLIRISRNMSGWLFKGTTAVVKAGSPIIEFVRAAAEHGLGGIEHAAGIPGTVGGLVVMNGGSKRKGIGDHISSVTIIDERGVPKRLGAHELKFKYRTSSLQWRKIAIVEVEMELDKVLAEVALSNVEEILANREGKFPLDSPNCGSTFLSDPALYATLGTPGQAIERAGLKGLRRGGARVSEKHANFILNVGGATSDDVLWLIATIRNSVWSQTGFALQAEVQHVARDGRVRPAHVAAAERYPELRTIE